MAAADRASPLAVPQAPSDSPSHTHQQTKHKGSGRGAVDGKMEDEGEEEVGEGNQSTGGDASAQGVSGGPNLNKVYRLLNEAVLEYRELIRKWEGEQDKIVVPTVKVQKAFSDRGKTKSIKATLCVFSHPIGQIGQKYVIVQREHDTADEDASSSLNRAGSGQAHGQGRRDGGVDEGKGGGKGDVEEGCSDLTPARILPVAFQNERGQIQTFTNAALVQVKSD